MRCHLIGFTLFTLGCLPGRAGTEDQSVTDYKTPLAPAAVATPASIKSAAAAKVEKPPSDQAVPTLPPRVVLEMPHSFVTRDSQGYSFHFAGASLPEIVEAVGSIFRTAMTYSGSATRTVSGRFDGRTPHEILQRLVDRTNLRFVMDGTAWAVEELGGDSPRIVSFPATAKPAPPVPNVPGDEAPSAPARESR